MNLKQTLFQIGTAGEAVILMFGVVTIPEVQEKLLPVPRKEDGITMVHNQQKYDNRG